jgi:excisionase family DNA binding protein
MGNESQEEDKMDKRKNAPPLTVREFATSASLSEKCIRAWIARRKIAIIRLGRAVRIPQSELDRLLTQSIQPARTGQR